MTFTDELRAESRGLDVLLAALPAAALLGVWLLPASVRRGYRFDYADPSVVDAYVAHFVHLEASHFLVNLAGYVVLIGTTYALAVLAGRRTRFRVTFVATFLALPWALSMANVAFSNTGVGFGFSGMVTGVLALLGLETYAYAAATLSLPLERGNAVLVFAVETVLITVALGAGERLVVVGAVSGILALAVGLLVVRTVRRSGVDVTRASRPGYLELGGIGVVLLVGFPFVAFPADPTTASGGVVNLYTHLLGFAFTFVAGYALPAVGSDGDDRRRRAAESIPGDDESRTERAGESPQRPDVGERVRVTDDGSVVRVTGGEVTDDTPSVSADERASRDDDQHSDRGNRRENGVPPELRRDDE
ncbi:MAG: hypothetical protein ABEH80_07870 [Halobaculum sp.]